MKSASPIDELIGRRLRAAGLEAAGRADDLTLIRRVALDLTGLPPTSEDIEFFRSQPADQAWERLIDRLLASPAFGERWASVWLDQARYADSAGYGSDPLRTIWRYRDWVVDAYNSNLPFDQFTLKQIAGDLLPNATTDDLLATAFHRNTKTNTEGGTDDEEFRVEAVRDRVDTTMLVWMGVSFGCAKCHDHKYDPFSQREYYELYDFYNQTEDADRGDERPKVPTPTPEQEQKLAEFAARADALRERLRGEHPHLDQAQRRWEEQARGGDAFSIMVPGEAVSEGGADLKRDGDGFVVASGESQERDTYRLTFEAPEEPVRSLRLELRPRQGGAVGREGGNGNIVLNEVRVGVQTVRPTPARFVRVELRGNRKILSLAEVEVLAGGDNVARGRVARQSSTGFGGPAKLAVDGNTSGRYEDQTVTHTNTETSPWWEVDLGQEVDVDSVRVWNRTDGDLEKRLAGYEVVLLDADRREIFRTASHSTPMPSGELHTDVRWLKLSASTASFGQSEFGVALAIDGSTEPRSGWAVSPRQRERHEAVFVLEKEYRSTAGDQLVVDLVQTYGGRHTIHALRLSASPTAAQALPSDVRAGLEVPRQKRSAEQAAAVAAHYRRIDPELRSIQAQIDALDAERSRVKVVQTPILRELPEARRRSSHIMKRGSFLSKAEAVEAGVPAVFPELPEAAARDRLALAKWLVRRDNPLTARVQVNRFWARLFGRGLVETEEDFGTQGAEPSHPELIDWLAVEFMENGWDVKALLKTIVMSEVYRRADAATEQMLEIDPDNRLLARGARFRLPAEMVRDSALMFSGLLSRKMGGAPVYPPQPDGLWRAAFNGQRSWRTSQGEDRWRRAIYTFVRRSSPYPAMATFDAPTREICTARRMCTNTPLQAFVTLNDPAFVECAQALARRIISEGGADARSRAEWALRLVMYREPKRAEVDAVVELMADELKRFTGREQEARSLAEEPLGALPAGVDVFEAAAWTTVANVLLNLDAVLVRR